MANVTISNCRALVCGQVKSCNIKIIDGKIKGIMPPSDSFSQTFDGRGKLFLPGLIDVHTQGALGIDFNTGSSEDIYSVRDFYASHGVTTFLPTIHSAPEQDMINSMNRINKAKVNLGCHQIYGINIDGPFLAPAYAGTMDKDTFLPCNYDTYRRLQDASGRNIKMVTISPELAGSQELIKRLSAEGIKVALGHSGADYETAMTAIENGAITGTHIFHGMKMMRPNNPAISAAILASDIFCQMICDSKLIHPGMMKMVMKSKGLERIVGITNSLKTTGAPDGYYQIGNQEVLVNGGETKYTNEDKNAGSMLTAIDAVKNFIIHTGVTLPQAMTFFTHNPAKLLGVSHTKGAIDIGKDADIIMVDDDLNVLATFSKGELIYQR